MCRRHRADGPWKHRYTRATQSLSYRSNRLIERQRELACARSWIPQSHHKPVRWMLMHVAHEEVRVVFCEHLLLVPLPKRRFPIAPIPFLPLPVGLSHLPINARLVMPAAMLVRTPVPISKPIGDSLKFLAWSFAPQSELAQFRQLIIRPLISVLFYLEAFEQSGFEETEGRMSVRLAFFLDAAHAMLEEMTHPTPAGLPVILGGQGIGERDLNRIQIVNPEALGSPVMWRLDNVYIDLLVFVEALIRLHEAVGNWKQADPVAGTGYPCRA